MDKQRIYICIAIILFFALLGILAYNYLEIYPRKKIVYPSSQVLNNNYIALERWLTESGYPVRNVSEFNPASLAEISENVIVVNSWQCNWEDTEEIIPWIEQGGFLVIALNYRSLDDELMEFLYGFGIHVFEYITPVSEQEESFPSFDNYISFLPVNEEEIFMIKDPDHSVKLVEVPIGKGAITVTGLPLFMYYRNLRDERNASLSWRLTGERAAKNTGVLFIGLRNSYAPRNSLFGAIMERGNLVPVIISAIILILTGFWMVIPAFGLVFSEQQRTSRPMKDRFTAEIRFLKKQQALNYYLEVYEYEHKENIIKEEKYNFRELINQYRRIFDGTAKF